MSEKDKWMEDSDVLSIFPTCVWKVQPTSAFRQNINSQILEVINQINPDLAEITGCWANINASGASHAIHSHPNNFLSGKYYISTHPGADSVALNESDKLRISISFNMMFSRYAERISRPLWGSTVDTPLGE